MKKRVVITGIGAVSPLGNDVSTLWDSLLAGRSGIAPIENFDTEGLPVTFAGEGDGETLGVEVLDRGDPASASEQAVPQRADVVAERGDGADPRDDDSLLHRFLTVGSGFT